VEIISRDCFWLGPHGTFCGRTQHKRPQRKLEKSSYYTVPRE